MPDDDLIYPPGFVPAPGESYLVVGNRAYPPGYVEPEDTRRLDVAALRAEEQATEEPVRELLLTWLEEDQGSDEGWKATEGWIHETLNASPERLWGRIRGLVLIARRILEPAGILGSPEWEQYQKQQHAEREHLDWYERNGFQAAFGLINSFPTLDPDTPPVKEGYEFLVFPSDDADTRRRTTATLRGLLYVIFTMWVTIAEETDEADSSRS